MNDFQGGIDFLLFVALWTAVCCALGYCIDKLRNHVQWIRRIAP
jgi:hypothetical protein